MEAVVSKLTNKLEVLEDEIYDSKSVLNSISKDIHVMSQTSIEMKDAIKKLLETEVKFQLHAQEVKQSQKEHSDLIKHLFKRVEKVEATVKVVDKDHEVVEKLSKAFWSALGWTAVVTGGMIVSAFIWLAENGVFTK